MALRTRVFEPSILTFAVMERFWAKTQRADNGCLEWTAAKTPVGYGRFGIGASAVYPAHRIALVWATGRPIPFGLDVDHLCHNVSCVEPAHLRAADRRTNIINSTNRGAVAAAGLVCKEGHDLTAPRAWVRSGDARTCRLCRNARATLRGKQRDVMDKKNARRRSRRLSDPEWAEVERAKDRERRRRG